jgi:hypothetical protein
VYQQKLQGVAGEKVIAIFTLPQVQSLVALELGRPFLEFMKAREQYVSLMEETAL